MLYIILTICFSVTVSVLFKLAKRYQIDVYQAVTWNYSMAVILTWLFLKPQLGSISHQAPFIVYGVLGILLPLLFLIIAASVSFTGIVRTDVAQRLSLFIPIIASFVIFGEKLNTLKLIGIIIGFAAIIFCIPWQKQVAGKKIETKGWFYLLIVFFGMGIIDLLFKQVALVTVVSYTTSLFIVFVLAFTVSLIGLIYQVVKKTMRFSWPHIFIGWTLGLANFANIFCYIKAHQALAIHPSTVFSGVNIGVIVLGAITGIFIFKEKLSTLNITGLALAIISIVIISLH
jgi:drug/metabolite transporter (DMT)-like permease